jgi:putative endonuclease
MIIMYYVYLLKSEEFDEIYVGSTNDLKRRLEEHNLGKEISTKKYMPWRLVSYEAYQSEKDARHREKMLKQHGNAMRQFKIKSKNSFINKMGLPSTIFFAKKNSAGFTLIETLIYIAIIGIVISSFVGFSVSVSDARGKTYVVQEVQANTREALSTVRSALREATDVHTASSVFGTDPGYLSLAMASSTLDPTNIGLDSDNGVLGIKRGTSATTSVTSSEVNITNLVFTNFTSSTTRENIRMELTVEYNNTSTSSIYNYVQTATTTTSLRK